MILNINTQGIQISYPLLILILLVIVWFVFIKLKRTDKYENIQDFSINRGELNYKMIICIRQDLGMGKGKIAAQCGHAVLGAYKRALKTNPEEVRKWENSGQAKIILKVELKDLFDLDLRAKKMNIVSFIVRDAGRTQVSPGEFTAIAIGPGPVEIIDTITGNFKLM